MNKNIIIHISGFPGSGKTTTLYSFLQFLDNQGIISLSQEFTEKVTMQFIIESKEVIRYMSLNPQDEEVLLTILRTYPGIYETQSAINVPLIAKKSNCNRNAKWSIVI